MSKYTKLAKGQQCQIRIPGVCCFDSTTTVHAHIRRGGVGGMGKKPPDICGVWTCYKCHDAIDGRIKTEYTKEQLDSMILDGLCRTLAKTADILKR